MSDVKTLDEIEVGAIAEMAKDWLALEEAFSFVIPSYGWMAARYDSANARLQGLVAFANARDYS